MQSYKEVGNSFATFKQLIQISGLGDINNILIGLAYLYCQKSIIQAHSTYRPQNELDMLNQIRKLLPSDNNFLRDIIHPLQSIFNHQLGSKKSESVSLQSTQKTQHKLSLDMVMGNIKQDNLLKAHLVFEDYDKVLELTEKMLTQVPAAQLLEVAVTQSSSQPSTVIQSLTHPQTTLVKTPDLPNSKISQSASNSTQSSNMEESLENLFKFYSEKKLSLESVNQIIEYLLASCNNKKTFIQQCLDAYQSVYECAPIGSQNINNLLDGMPVLFHTFTQYLALKDLNKLMHDLQFNLADTKKENNEASYQFYCVLKAIMFGEDLFQLSLNNAAACWLRYESIFKYITLLGNRLVEPSQEIKPKELLYLPPALQFKIRQLDEKTAHAFLNFLNKYQEINKRADSFQQRPIALFLIKFDDKIIQLIDMMGIHGIAYLGKQLAGTALTLERILENLPLLDSSLIAPMRAYYLKLQSAKQDGNVDNLFFNCLIAAGILTLFHKKDSEFKSENALPLADVIMKMAEGKSPHQFLLAMGSVIIRKILPDISVEITEQQIAKMFKRIPPERFVKLVLACQKMKENEYKEVFLQLLKLDLTGGNVNAFLHETKQDNPIGRDLSQHNAKIRQRLEYHKISPNTALHYRKIYNFVIRSAKEDLNGVANMQLVLWGYLKKLEEQVSENLSRKIPSKQLTRFQTIKTCLSEIKKSIKDEKKSEMIAEKLSHPVNKSLIEKIIKNYSAIKQDNDKQNVASAKQDAAPAKQDATSAKQSTISVKQDTTSTKQDAKQAESSISSVFFEFAEHVKEQFDLIKRNPVKDGKEKKDQRKNESYYFSVEQWPKERVQTFFLGDDVGCCLATDGAQFQAMVQRRMDDAMLFHVATDKVTGKPAALAWLYLAETQSGKIVLIANFFEVNAKYGGNQMLRVPLLNGILKFTEQYLKDNPGIQGFYMNQLTYGWNIEDIKNYSIKSFPITDKVGGPYLLDNPNRSIENHESLEGDSELTKNKYYLVSLHQNEFHQFDSAVLAKEVEKSNLRSVKEIVKHSMLEMDQKGLTYPAMVQEVSQKHRIELENFYSKPITTCEAFLADMKLWHTEIHLSKTVIPKSMFDKSQPQPQSSSSSTSQSFKNTL